MNTTDEPSLPQSPLQTCMLDSTGKILWADKAWTHREVTRLIAANVGDNYIDACHAADQNALAGLDSLTTALTQLSEGSSDSFALQVTHHATGEKPERYLIRGEAIAYGNDRLSLLTHDKITQEHGETTAPQVGDDTYKERLDSMRTKARSIAHDFNNILSVIAGNAEMAQLDATDPRVRESLTEIEKASQRAKPLVHEISVLGQDQQPD